jgi:hypothetical protein
VAEVTKKQKHRALPYGYSIRAAEDRERGLHVYAVYFRAHDYDYNKWIATCLTRPLAEAVVYAHVTGSGPEPQH